MSPLSASLVTIALSIFISFTHATTIDVLNNCPYTVWAAADPGSGMRLGRGATWKVTPDAGTKMARIWGRTGCRDDGTQCATGDCGKLDCDPGNWGKNPKTLLEYTLAQPGSNDIIDISLIEGFNIPLDFTPTSNAGSLDGKCRRISCTANVNGRCPRSWKVRDGCNSPCTTSGLGSCGANGDSKFFKQQCPDAYSYPKDDQSSTYSCPPGTNYKLTFCP
jgi:hypothetical protein